MMVVGQSRRPSQIPSLKTNATKDGQALERPLDTDLEKVASAQASLLTLKVASQAAMIRCPAASGSRLGDRRQWLGNADVW